MGKIAVFDSGLGSLSIIKAIQKITTADIVYFADQKNYPYGTKTKSELRKIIFDTIALLKKEFAPELIVLGSNTPSILFPSIFTKDQAIIGVLPPLTEAEKITKANSIGILATNVTIKSKSMQNYIDQQISSQILITKIDATTLIDLVESGKFIFAKNFCLKKIHAELDDIFELKKIDVVTLSSTHLPFLLPLLKEIFPRIKFLDPAEQIANKIVMSKFFSKSKKNSLQIFCSGDVNDFEKKLKKLGVKESVKFLEP